MRDLIVLTIWINIHVKICNLALKFVCFCTSSYFCLGGNSTVLQIVKRVQPMGCSPRFKQCKNVGVTIFIKSNKTLGWYQNY